MSNRLLPALILAALLLAACGPAPENPEAALTAAAATLDARLDVAQAESALQTAEAEQATLEAELANAEATNQALQAAGTQTAVFEATQAAIDPQLISPSGTICRQGANAAFPKAADIAANQPIDVIARSTDGEWWQVPHPDDPAETCWVFWDADLDFLGDVFNLPLVAGPALPQPTLGPTNPPGFALNFDRENICTGTSYFIIAVSNTGPETYQSASVSLINADTSSNIARSDGNNEFLASANSCPKGNASLGPGLSAYLAVPSGAAPSGGSLRVSVRLCTENGLKGSCISSNTSFSN